VFEETEAIELLRIRFKIDNAEFNPAEKHEATEIVKELGYLALAIEQASAFIRSALQTIFEFLPIYQRSRNSRKRLLQREPASKVTYPNSVADTFLLSLDKMNENRYGHEAVTLLKLFAFLNLENIRIDFVRDTVKSIDAELRTIVSDEITFYEALELLQ
jgi:hypothetical protein